MQWRLRRMQWLRRQLSIRTYDISEPDKEEIRGLKMDKQKEMIIARLREKGCRITKQRLELLDIILNNQCSSCKEIHYLATKVDSGIGIATVYRMVNELEDIGVISRKIVYDRAMAV